jgi:hypothetical protein
MFGERVTGAGWVTLRDIRLVELQEQANNAIAAQMGASFMWCQVRMDIGLLKGKRITDGFITCGFIAEGQ